MSYKTTFLAFILLIVASFSCKKSNQADKIPVVPVSVTIYLNLPSNIALNSIGNYVKTQGGYRGIVVYRRSLTEFVAFDLACPFDPQSSGAILDIDSNGISTIDHHCGSRFDLTSGSVLNGPATSPMKAYSADYDGGNTVYIYN